MDNFRENGNEYDPELDGDVSEEERREIAHSDLEATIEETLSNSKLFPPVESFEIEDIKDRARDFLKRIYDEYGINIENTISVMGAKTLAESKKQVSYKNALKKAENLAEKAAQLSKVYGMKDFKRNAEIIEKYGFKRVEKLAIAAVEKEVKYSSMLFYDGMRFAEHHGCVGAEDFIRQDYLMKTATEIAKGNGKNGNGKGDELSVQQVYELHKSIIEGYVDINKLPVEHTFDGKYTTPEGNSRDEVERLKGLTGIDEPKPGQGLRLGSDRAS